MHNGVKLIMNAWTISKDIFKCRMIVGHFPPFLENLSDNSTKRSKMSHCHSDKFSQKGGKCPTVILTSCHKNEENVPPSFRQVFTKRRKMSRRHYDKFSKKGGKCPTIILTSFHKKEENVLPSF